MIVHTPPMGWNTWNTFGKDINEQLIRESADYLVESGLAAAGYNYVVIDDCWAEKTRDKNGKLVPDRNKFPSGMRALADYIHSKGLKFGMYTCAGTLTCEGYPGSYDHEYIDAQTFAEWHVDFLKYDFCYRPNILEAKILYRRMGLALASCGRDILFSACSWGKENTHEWIKTTGAHMWRSTGDIKDVWKSIYNLTMAQEQLFQNNARGCFNDMDMLVVGMHGEGNVALEGGCSIDEYRTHFSLWALLASPLMIGCDIRKMDEESRKILMNREVIAINQDPAANQPYRIIPAWEFPDALVLVRMLENGDLAIGVFNMGEDACTVTFGLDELGITCNCGKTLHLHEVWTGKDCLPENSCIRISRLSAHACRLYRASLI